MLIRFKYVSQHRIGINKAKVCWLSVHSEVLMKCCTLPQRSQRQQGWITSAHVQAVMTTVIKFRREVDMSFFRLVEGTQVKERKIPFVFDSKRECFSFSTFTNNILKTSWSASKIFLQEMPVNMTLLSTHFVVLWRIDFNSDEPTPKKLPSIYFVFDPLLGLSEMMLGDIDGDMNCI